MRQNNCNLVRVSLCGKVEGSVLWLGQVSCFCGELQAQNMVKSNRASPVCSVVWLRLKLDDSTTSDFVVEQCIGLWNFQLRIWSEVFKLNRCSQDHQKFRRKNFSPVVEDQRTSPNVEIQQGAPCLMITLAHRNNQADRTRFESISFHLKTALRSASGELCVHIKT
jgi:hypothetical protein